MSTVSPISDKRSDQQQRIGVNRAFVITVCLSGFDPNSRFSIKNGKITVKWRM
jgi:hypothetical protein